ncbi:MAG: TetR/AcrR family transcriptional regulator [Clostridia bacterium]|nr:TetR/AcrR family transcriptional regulator [Clostridia bacterium]
MSNKKTYERILEVAYEMFSTLGYDQTSMAMIAKALGISKPALYYHFQSKEQIFEQLYSFVVDLVIQGYKLPETLDSKEDFKIYMCESGNANIDYMKKNPSFSKLMMQYLLLGIRNENIGRITKRLESETHEHISRQVALGIKLGVASEKEREILVELIKMVDQSLLEKVDVLSEDELKAIWKLFMDSIF